MNCMDFDVEFLEDGVAVEASFMKGNGNFVTHRIFREYPWLEDEEEDEAINAIGMRFDGTLIFENEVSE